MAHQMRLDFRVAGLAQFNRAAEAVERMARAQKSMSQAGGGSIVPVGSPGPGGGSLPVPSGGGGRRPPVQRFLPGPHQRFQMAQLNMNKAWASGNPAAIADAQYQMGLAQRGLQRLAPPSFGSRLNSLVNSTRVGGNVAPLVGRILPLLGISSKLAGPIGLAAMAAYALWKGADMASKSLQKLGDDMAKGGGSYAQTRAARVLSDATGVDIIGATRGFQKQYFDGGIEGLHLRRYGYSARSGMGRDTNALGPGMEAIRKMVQGGDLRALQDLNLEGLYNLRYLKKSEVDQYFKSMERAMSPDRIASAMRFNIAMANLKMSFEDALHALAPLAEGLARLFENKNGGMWKPSKGTWGYNGEDGDPAARNADAMNRNTDAVNGLTDSIDSMRKDIRGGGERARNAIPSGWTNQMLQEAERRRMIALGAFTV